MTGKTHLVDEELCRRRTREGVTREGVRIEMESDKEEMLIKRRDMREKGVALDEDLTWLEARST